MICLSYLVKGSIHGDADYLIVREHRTPRVDGNSSNLQSTERYGLAASEPYSSMPYIHYVPRTTFMPRGFSLLSHRRSATGARCNGPVQMTVTARWIPLVTAAYGTWVAWPATTTWLPPDSDGLPARQEGQPGPRWRFLVGKPRRWRGSSVDPLGSHRRPARWCPLSSGSELQT
jgi:hypothetical protein